MTNERTPAEPFIPERGRFADDPTWDEYMANIAEYRRQMNDTDDAEVCTCESCGQPAGTRCLPLCGWGGLL